jgi:hypothetical protein
LDRSCENGEVLLGVKDRNILHTIKRMKANWIDDTLCRNFLLKRVAKGNTKGRIEMTGRRGRRRKQLLDVRKETRYWRWKDEALDYILWRTCFERGYGHVRQAT